MKHEYKEGDKVKLLFNGGGGTGTCYEPGDILTIMTVYDVGSFNVQKDNRAGQIVYSCQIEPVLTLPTKGDYVSIINDEGLIHLVKVTDYPKEHNGTFKAIHLEGFHLDLKSSVFHKNAVAAFTLEGNLFKDCEPTDKHWLDWCIAADCFVDKKDVPKIGDWILIRPSSTTTITGRLRVLLGQNVEVNHLHYRGQSAKGNLLKEIFNVRTSNIKTISEETIRSLHKNDDHLSEEMNNPVVDDGNGGFKVGDYILIDAPGEQIKIATITAFSSQPQDKSTIYAYLSFISSKQDFKTNWYCCIKGKNIKTEPLDEDKKRWLEYCINLSKYVAYESVPNPQKEVKSVPELTFPVSGWCKKGDEELGKFLADKFDSLYEPPGKSGYAWDNNSYWRIEVASGKPIWSIESLKSIIEKSDYRKKLVEMIKEYTKVPTIEENTNMLYVKGDVLCITAIKNDHGFKIGEKVKIIIVSSHVYICKSLERDTPLWRITPDECTKWIPDTSGKMIGHKYKVGEILKIEKKLHGHGFAIGEQVVVKELHIVDTFYRCSSVIRYAEWDIGENEVTLVTDSDKNYDNKYLVDEAEQIPKYTVGCDGLDNSIPHVWVCEPTNTLHTIPNHWEATPSVIKESNKENTPKDDIIEVGLWPRKLYSLFGKTNKVEIKNRKVEPVEVSTKIKNIDKGLIVPLEPIKDRIIK